MGLHSLLGLPLTINGEALAQKKVSRLSPNSKLRASSSQRFSSRESPDEGERRSVARRLYARNLPRAVGSSGYSHLNCSAWGRP
jgi:hypothetical protein